MANEQAEAKAALMLLAGLIDALDRAFPGTNLHIDQYLVEMSSRPAAEKGPIFVARELLAGLRDGA